METSIEELKNKLYCLEQALDNVKEGILISNKDSRIIFYNKAMAKLDGLEQSKVLGKKISEIYDVDEDHSEHVHVFNTGEPIKEGNRIYYTAEGNQVDLVYKTVPIYKDGSVIGVYSLCRNVAKLKELLERTMQLQSNASDELHQNKTLYNNNTTYTFDDIIGSSKIMKQLINEAKQISTSSTPILIVGETGTGKELFAQSIHNYSQNKEQPFIALNCAAIPENLLESLLFGTVKGAFTGSSDMSGFFEQANEGTLFLDEINSMPFPLQAKLLRVLQERRARRIGGTYEYPIKCRIISSTNEDPEKSLHKKQLRSDLYYRIAGLVLTIPPLREHSEDIEELIDTFLKRYCLIYKKKIIKLDKELYDFLEAYKWPGNIRQLQHVIENIVIRATKQIATIEDLPVHFKKEVNSSRTISNTKENVPFDLNKKLESIEKDIILDVLLKNKWNISKSANYLGLNRQNLQYKIKKYNLSLEK